jgi:hypothetical protein
MQKAGILPFYFFKKRKEELTMGAEFFTVEAWGASPEAAFDKIRQEYGRMYGCSGYSGTIVEKDSFIIFPLPEGANPEEYAVRIALEDPRIDKWGPAGCFVLKEARTAEVKIKGRKVEEERDDHLTRAVILYSVNGCSTGACYGMYPTLEEAEEAAKNYAAKHLEKIELKKEVVAPSNTLFIYEPEDADEYMGHYFFFGYAPY